MRSNFRFLSTYWQKLASIGSIAESYLYSDLNACISKLGLLAESVVLEIAVNEKITSTKGQTHADRIRILQNRKMLPRNIDSIIYAICKARNDISCTYVIELPRAEMLLRLAYHLCVWFMKVYGDGDFSAPDFSVPDERSQDADSAEMLRSLEEQIDGSSDGMRDLPTPRNVLTVEARRQQAIDVSEKLNFTDAETQYLIGKQVRLEVSVLSVVNYAVQQNKLPIIQSVTIVNNSGIALKNIDIRITSSPELCLPCEKHLDFVPADGRYDIKDISLILNGDLLCEFTEKVTGLLHISLGCGADLLFSDSIEITALAFDEWHGGGYFPEILSAFVIPNHPEIVKINARAAELLAEWTKDPSFDAYLTKNNSRVCKQAAAIYGAIQEQNIVYAIYPASFEKVGQRVRLCDTIMQEKMGCCLDMSLFYAACLEAVGLHPIIIISKHGNQSHAFVGVWLEDLTFPEAVQYDPSLITKRLANGICEIAVVECTLMRSGVNISFDAACRSAEKHMLGEEPIYFFIDVKRARLSGVSPLPLRIRTEDGWRIKREPVKDLTPAPQKPNMVIDVDDVGNTRVLSKKAQWERKLLDLGLRNSLINMRVSKTLVPILSPTLDKLEDALSDGRDFSVLPRPSDYCISERKISFEMMHDLGDSAALILSEFRNARLHSSYIETDLLLAVKELYRASKTAMEENGTNALYLAL